MAPLWNDDAIMETKDWDLEIGKYDDSPYFY